MIASGAVAAALSQSQGAPAAAPPSADVVRMQRDGAAALKDLQRYLATNQRSDAPAASPAPSEPKVTVNADGKMTVVSPDGGTTIVYPDGRTTHIYPNGVVEQSAPPPVSMRDANLTSDGEVVSMVSASALIAFFVGRWWGMRRSRKRSAPAPEGAAAIGAVPVDLGERIDRIEHAVESVAIEVERISEGQRFTTKLLAERPETGVPVPALRPDQFAGGGR